MYHIRSASLVATPALSGLITTADLDRQYLAVQLNDNSPNHSVLFLWQLILAHEFPGRQVITTTTKALIGLHMETNTILTIQPTAEAGRETTALVVVGLEGKEVDTAEYREGLVNKFVEWVNNGALGPGNGAPNGPGTNAENVFGLLVVGAVGKVVRMLRSEGKVVELDGKDEVDWLDVKNEAWKARLEGLKLGLLGGSVA